MLPPDDNTQRPDDGSALPADKCRSQLDLLLAGGDCISFILTADGELVDVAGPLEALTGCSRQQLTGDDNDLLNKVLSHRQIDLLKSTEGDAKTFTHSFWHLCPDGREIAFDASAMLLKSYGELSPAIGVVCRDVSRYKLRQRRMYMRSALSELAGEASKLFLEADQSDFNSHVDTALAMAGKAVGADRCYLFEMETAKKLMHNTYEWCAAGIEPQIDSLQDIDFSMLPWWTDQILHNRIITIEDVSALPDYAVNTREILEPQGIKSLIVLPVYLARNDLYGFIGFDSVAAHRKWDQQTVSILKLFSEILGSSISSYRTQKALLIAVDKAETAIRAKDEFLANMSHEIRTPLNGVMGMLELLEDEPLTETQQDYVDTMNHSAKILLGVINDILDLAKLDAGKVAINLEAMSIYDLLEKTVALYEPTAAQKNLKFEVKILCDLPQQVEGDPLRISQILGNLLSNAIKFTSDGTITLSVNRENDNYTFSVRDTGIGMSNEQLKRIFERFEQADGSTTRKYGGTGLGLSICKRLTQLMGGDIFAESIENEGSCFHLQLELSSTAQASDAVDADDAQPDEATPATSCHVLIVEDTPVNAVVLGGMLKRIPGCTYDLAEDGIEAMAAIDQIDYDLVFMDLHMPNMDGIEAARRIRRLDGEKAKTPIVALTADIFPEVRRQCLAAGMNDFATKPLHFSQIREFIDTYVGSGVAS